MKVLVTGATGFIGSHVVRLLVREGCDVYALIRKTSSTWRIEDILDSIKVIHGDLLEFANIGRQLETIQPETCLHLAWYAVPGKYLVSEENLNMLTASINLASHLAKSGCKRFVATGTCLEYDTKLGYLSESSATKATTLYAACKLALYHILTQLDAASGMSVAWARLFYQYGPYEDPRRLVPSIVCSLLRGEAARITHCEQVHDYLHVEDTARALWAVAGCTLSGAVNVGSGRPISVRDIAGKIGGILGHPDLIRFDTSQINKFEPEFVCANNSHLRANTGWFPRFEIDEGLQDTIDWWRGRLRA